MNIRGIVIRVSSEEMGQHRTRVLRRVRDDNAVLIHTHRGRAYARTEPYRELEGDAPGTWTSVNGRLEA